MKKIAKVLVLFLIVDLIFISYTQNIQCSEIKERKIVYLTFDDGPSFSNTDAILDILCKNNVKATFCVVGENVIVNKGTMRRLNNLKMGIIPHCNNHEYKELYSSSQNYISDLQKCIKAINMTIGENRTYNMVRMPGGSTNRVCDCVVLNEIKSELNQDDFYYLDWTLDCGDTHAPKVDTSVIKDNIISNAGRNNIEVILMHDLENKTTTTEALQEIIDTYKKLGYEFKSVYEMEEWEKNILIDRGVINRN